MNNKFELEPLTPGQLHTRKNSIYSFKASLIDNIENSREVHNFARPDRNATARAELRMAARRNR